MRNYLFVTLLIACAVALGFAQGNHETGLAGRTIDRSGTNLRLSGSVTLSPVAEGWAERYSQQQPDVTINVESEGSGAGIRDLLNGSADIAMASRPIKDSEVERAGRLSFEIREIEVARAGMAVIVHKDNPVQSLTDNAIRDIFTGATRNWRDVGGPDRPIAVVIRGLDSNTRVFFRDRMLSGRNFAPECQEKVSNSDVIGSVGRDPWAIGFTGLNYALSLDGHERIAIVLIEMNASQSGSVGSEIEPETQTYALGRPLYFYTSRDPRADVGRFINFVLSEENQEQLLMQGFFSVSSPRSSG